METQRNHFQSSAQHLFTFQVCFLWFNFAIFLPVDIFSFTIFSFCRNVVHQCIKYYNSMSESIYFIIIISIVDFSTAATTSSSNFFIRFIIICCTCSFSLNSSLSLFLSFLWCSVVVVDWLFLLTCTYYYHYYFYSSAFSIHFVVVVVFIAFCIQFSSMHKPRNWNDSASNRRYDCGDNDYKEVSFLLQALRQNKKMNCQKQNLNILQREKLFNIFFFIFFLILTLGAREYKHRSDAFEGR